MRSRTVKTPVCRFGRTLVALGFALGATSVGPALVAPARGDAPQASADRFDRVVIDAGHGGENDGARGPSGALEKRVALETARELARALEKRGIEVVMTRTGDVHVSLEQRTAVANDARADLFVSIHANAAADRRIRGTETFFLSLDASDASALALAERENRSLGVETARRAVTDDPMAAIFQDLLGAERQREAQEFAGLVQHRLERLDGAGSRGVKQAPFVVLEGVLMPAALVEIGFITNPEEERRLRSAAGRAPIIAALADAVVEFGRRYDARRGGGAAAQQGGR